MNTLNRQQTIQLATFLKSQGLIDDANLRRWVDLSDESGQTLLDLILEQSGLTEEAIAHAFSSAFGLPIENLQRDEDVSSEALQLVPKKFILSNRILPFKKEGARLFIAISEPENLEKIAQLKLITEFDIEARVITLSAMRAWLIHISAGVETYVPKTLVTDSMHVEEEEEEDSEFAEQAGSSEVILFVNEVIAMAIERGVSDIHVEPYKKRVRLRYRLDGVLYDQSDKSDFLWAHFPAVITRMKIMAKLNIAERRLPQDGAITFKTMKG